MPRGIPSASSTCPSVPDQLGERAERDTPEEMSPAAKKRTLPAEAHTASMADKEIATQRSQFRDPSLEDAWDASPLAPMRGVGSATSARMADFCGKTSGSELASSESKNMLPLRVAVRNVSSQPGRSLMFSLHGSACASKICGGLPLGPHVESD